MKQVSIIIVTYNSEKDIFDCVDSIQHQADIPLEDIELIVVDNCSRESEPMFERLRQQWGEDIVLIENAQNGGYGRLYPLSLYQNLEIWIIHRTFACRKGAG